MLREVESIMYDKKTDPTATMLHRKICQRMAAVGGKIMPGTTIMPAHV